MSGIIRFSHNPLPLQNFGSMPVFSLIYVAGLPCLVHESFSDETLEELKNWFKDESLSFSLQVITHPVINLIQQGSTLVNRQEPLSPFFVLNCTHHPSVFSACNFPMHSRAWLFYTWQKIFSACFLLPNVFRDKHEKKHIKPSLHMVNQICIEH